MVHRLRALFFSLTALAVVLATLAAASPVAARNSAPPNVIVVILDDFGWNELPFFTPPVQWSEVESRRDLEDLHRQQRVINPALNRLAARMLALRTCDDG